MGVCLLPGSLPFYFCQLIPRVSLLVFLLVSAAINDENYLKFNWLWYWAVTGQGHHSGTLAAAAGADISDGFVEVLVWATMIGSFRARIPAGRGASSTRSRDAAHCRL